MLSASHQVGPGVPILGVNSARESSVGFFCAARKGAVEQKSSGLWIGPAARSTAAQRGAVGKVLPLTYKIQFVVREPYVRLGTKLAPPQGLVGEEGEIVLHSKMKEARLFLDAHQIVHEIAMGDVLTMRRSEESLTVLGLRRPGAVQAPLDAALTDVLVRGRNARVPQCLKVVLESRA